MQQTEIECTECGGHPWLGGIYQTDRGWLCLTCVIHADLFPDCDVPPRLHVRCPHCEYEWDRLATALPVAHCAKCTRSFRFKHPVVAPSPVEGGKSEEERAKGRAEVERSLDLL